MEVKIQKARGKIEIQNLKVGGIQREVNNFLAFSIIQDMDHGSGPGIVKGKIERFING